MSNDRIMVQVALKMRLPRGKKVPNEVLQQILHLIAQNEPLPKVVSSYSVFWRNPERKGEAGYWRYHQGADLSQRPKGPIQSAPRGSLQDAVDTLSAFIESGSVTF